MSYQKQSVKGDMRVIGTESYGTPPLHIIDPEHARFMDFRRYAQQNQEQLDQFLLSPSNIISAINGFTSLTTALHTRLV